MRMRYKLCVTCFLVITLALSGCVQEDGDTTGEKTSLTTVYISDAPSDNFSHINVTFSQVKIHKSGDDNDSGWILFDMESKTVDMIYLHEHNLSEELGVKNLTVGNYTKLWIVVDDATGVLKDTGEEIVFDVPSGDLKIQQSFEIREGNTTIDVEIDLDRSVLYVPQGGVYKLRPQLGSIRIDHEQDDDDDDEDDMDDEDDDEEEFQVDAGEEYEGSVNETIEFEAEVEGGVEPFNWSWDFGDGNMSTNMSPEYTYHATGTYTVTVTVTDDEGAVATDTATVTIEEES